jgi:UDP-N-acetylmuramate dehydrogenase
MTATRSWVGDALAVLRDVPPLRALRDVPLGPRTYLGVGGAAPLLLVPDDPAVLARALSKFTEAGVPFDYLGAGSNLLVADSGPSFVVVTSEALAAEPRISGGTVVAGAGFPAPRLVTRLVKAGLSGLEFAEGIPGSVGGCVRMNAGWHEGSFGQAVTSVTCISRRGDLSEVRVLPGTFAYRSSPGLEGRFIVEATLSLVPRDPAQVEAKVREYHDARVATQPTGERNAGCIFKNPPGDHAGRLIDACGLKGRAIGSAVVSDRHANFIINRGGATCRDVQALIDAVRETVMKKTGVALETEVVLWT